MRVVIFGSNAPASVASRMRHGRRREAFIAQRAGRRIDRLVFALDGGFGRVDAGEPAGSAGAAGSGS